MSINPRYLRDERLLIRSAVILGLTVGTLAFFLARGLSPDRAQVSPVEVWEYVHEIAPKRGIDPAFVYALAWAESSLDARARSSVARGMMQLTKPAWEEVSDAAYRHAWDWKTNVRVGVDYLASCKDFLHRHDAFNYPLLAACYRYGPYYVKKRNFDLRQIRQPKNRIYQSIFDGVIRPVAPPEL